MSELHCEALDCKHNTANRSHGESAGLCDYRHTAIGDGGMCLDFEPVEDTVVKSCDTCLHSPADRYKHPCDKCCYQCSSWWEAKEGL